MICSTGTTVVLHSLVVLLEVFDGTSFSAIIITGKHYMSPKVPNPSKKRSHCFVGVPVPHLVAYPYNSILA